MNAGRRTKIKYIAIALLSALLLTAAVWLGGNIFGKRTEVPFSEKLVLNLRDGNAGEEEYTASVTLQYAETFSCRHGEIETDEELEEHRAELKAYYKARNEKIVKELNLKDCTDVSYSWFGPYIEYRYENADAFLASDLSLVKNADSPILEKVFVSNYSAEPQADRNSEDDRPVYSFVKALTDTGLATLEYRGQGIKIGVWDIGIPDNYKNLQGITYHIYGETADSHPFWVSSILGGKVGIASKAEIYFASQEDNKYVDCGNWFVENGVNVINCSFGFANGRYTGEAAYADYLVKQFKITIVASAGNEGDMNSIRAPGVGLNVICVAANDANLAMTSLSSTGMRGEEKYSLANPTLTAPGGGITYVPNINLRLSGTSFSAPFVTGIVALLMDEFPTLKTHPEQIMALLSNTCTPAKGQTEIWDKDAGFGIVNYERARKYYKAEFLSQFSTPDKASKAGTDCTNIYLQLPLGSIVTAKATVLFNSQYTDNLTVYPQAEYSDIRIAIRDYKTNKEVAAGDTLSNLSYITFKNETYLNQNPITEFTISIYLKSDKNFTGTEHGAVSYYTHDAEDPYGVVVSDGKAVESDGTAWSGIYYVIVAADAKIETCYIKTPSSDSWQTYQPYTVIPASSENGKYEFKFTYVKNNKSTLVETTVYLDTVTPVLTVQTQTYGGSPKTSTLTNNNCNEFTQLYTAFKVVRIDGDASSKIDVTKDGKTKTYSGGNLPELNGGVYVIRVYNYVGNSYSFNLKVLGADPEILFNVSADKMSLTVSVSFEQPFEEAEFIRCYCDGKFVGEWTGGTGYWFRIDGEYRVVLKDNIGRTIEKSYTFAKPKPVGVLSVADGASTNNAVSFTYGNNFSAEVLKDGEEFAFDTPGEINFTDDGKYSVKLYYTSDAKSYTEYNFEIDTVPPAFDISGVDENGVSTSSVVISGIEDGVTLEVFHNGALINYTAGENITAAGEYEVRLTDAAGNVSNCSFIIEKINPDSGDTPVWVVVFVAALVVAVGAVTAVTVVIFRKRRK